MAKAIEPFTLQINIWIASWKVIFFFPHFVLDTSVLYTFQIFFFFGFTLTF